MRDRGRNEFRFIDLIEIIYKCYVSMTAQEKAESSIEVAGRSKDDADTARICAMQFDPSFKQPGVFAQEYFL